MNMQQRPTDTESWVPAIDRRTAIASGAVLAGYALAARPVSASAILTAATGLDAGMTRFAAGNGFTMNAYRAKPAGSKDAPVILVVQEVFGLHEWVKDICRRLAAAGYYAIAPDLYQRQGDATKIADIAALVKDIVQKVPDAQVLADLDAAAVFAGKDGGDASRLGVTGFCWGGRIVWLYSAHNPKLRAGVAWYGRLIADSTPLQPQSPIDLVGQLHAPVLGLYGGQDSGIPLADVEKMQAALKAAGGASRIDVFASAGHGFLADYRPSYDEAAAKQAWHAALGWFAEHLKARSG
jgi:carboxymethylenebutenolidase